MELMNTRRTWWVLALGVLVACRAAAGAEWRPAVVRLSDGTTVTGSLYIPNDSIQIYDAARRRRYTLRPAELKRLETIIERQGLEERWLFRQSGLDDKVRTGRYYPVREYRTRATFHDGRQVSGHVIAKTVHVRTEDRRLRYILRHKHEGDVGQHLGDLVYVRSIDFLGEGAGASGSIEGALTLPAGETLRRVVAINREKLFSAEAAVNPASGRFRVENCTEGEYDLAVVTDRAIYLHFGREADEDAGRLNAEQVAEIQEWVDRLRDFFHSQTVLYAAGNPERAFALVRQERRGGTTLPGLELLHRYEVWAMHQPEEEWQIEKRFVLWRDAGREQSIRRLEVVLSPELSGHSVCADNETVALEARLRRASEPLIAPPPEEEAATPPRREETVPTPDEE